MLAKGVPSAVDQESQFLEAVCIYPRFLLRGRKRGTDLESGVEICLRLSGIMPFSTQSELKQLSCVVFQRLSARAAGKAVEQARANQPPGNPGRHHGRSYAVSPTSSFRARRRSSPKN